MFRRRLQPKNLLKTTLAALLLITLSGAYCLFCCQEIIAAAKQWHQPKAHASQSENCHFSKTKATETTKTSVGVSGFEGCSLKFNLFIAKLEKKEFPKQTFVAAINFFSFPEFLKPAQNRAFPALQYRAPVHESDDLNVKNCVFRI